MTEPSRERADLLETLRTRRYFLRRTVEGITDEQAAQRLVPSSELCLGGLIKHCGSTEEQWLRFIAEGPAVMEVTEWTPELQQARVDDFSMLPGETLASLLTRWDGIAARTDAAVQTADLDAAQPLPSAPWFTPGATRSARGVFLHLISETAHHAGHADILREALDGQKTM